MNDDAACSYCAKKKCFVGDFSQSPPNCPTLTRTESLASAREKLAQPDNLAMAQDVARTWKDYGKLTRVEETVLYAKLQGAKNLGLAFCVGLAEEARKFTNVLLNAGFDVTSVCCSVDGLSADDVDLPVEDRVLKEGRQPMCNPIGQAEVMNRAGTDLNIILGLCVGDDTLFIKHSEAPVTVLAVKDRVLAHNPLAALYTSDTIYRRINTRKPKSTDQPKGETNG